MRPSAWSRRTASTVVLLGLLVLAGGCIVPMEEDVRIEMPQGDHVGTIVWTMRDLCSDESTEVRRGEDLDSLLGVLHGDRNLAVAASQGRYVKSRNLWVDHDTLNYREVAIFSDRAALEKGLQFLPLESDSSYVVRIMGGGIVSTNGRVVTDSATTFIRWPRESTLLEYGMREKARIGKSLAPEYLARMRSAAHPRRALAHGASRTKSTSR